MTVAADDCDLRSSRPAFLDGLRAVAVDVDVPRAETIGVVLESSSTQRS